MLVAMVHFGMVHLLTIYRLRMFRFGMVGMPFVLGESCSADIGAGERKDKRVSHASPSGEATVTI